MKPSYDRSPFQGLRDVQGHSSLNARLTQRVICDRAITTNTVMSTHQPLVVDLGMSDTDYLEQLAQGHDPVKAYRNQSYQTVLLSYGIPLATAAQITPLIDKLDCSIEEKMLVNQTLKHIWHQLIGQTA
ncbi:MAG: hypothetical protein KME45_24415 [Stenomitos rutilans HA7619-LM2]|jgi:hypothetical protein|nr:hypothetical protein [Stenomitos rutilans HA7619-LM2]